MIYYQMGEVKVVFTFWGNREVSPFHALTFLPLLTRLWYTFLWAIGLLEIESKPGGAYFQSIKTIEVYLDNLWKNQPEFLRFSRKLVDTLDHEIKHYLGYKHTTAERKEWKVSKRVRFG